MLYLIIKAHEYKQEPSIVFDNYVAKMKLVLEYPQEFFLFFYLLLFIFFDTRTYIPRSLYAVVDGVPKYDAQLEADKARVATKAG